MLTAPEHLCTNQHGRVARPAACPARRWPSRAPNHAYPEATVSLLPFTSLLATATASPLRKHVQKPSPNFRPQSSRVAASPNHSPSRPFPHFSFHVFYFLFPRTPAHNRAASRRAPTTARPAHFPISYFMFFIFYFPIPTTARPFLWGALWTRNPTASMCPRSAPAHPGAREGDPGPPERARGASCDAASLRRFQTRDRPATSRGAGPAIRRPAHGSR